MKVEIREMTSKEVNYELLFGLMGLLFFLAAFCWLQFFGTPAIVCNMKRLFHIPCPTCGATRSFVALTEGNVSKSFRMNPFVFAVYCFGLIYVPYALLCCSFKWKRIRISFSPKEWVGICSAIVLAFFGVWVFLIFDGR